MSVSYKNIKNSESAEFIACMKGVRFAKSKNVHAKIITDCQNLVKDRKVLSKLKTIHPNIKLEWQTRKHPMIKIDLLRNKLD